MSGHTCHAVSARDTATLLFQLEQAKLDVIAGIDHTVTTLKGSVEFRNAVEDLLKGTPHEKPAEDRYDFEGLYGRLRAALVQGRGVPQPQFPIPLTEVQEQAAKDWAADDRLWTTQETVEINLRTFARTILKLAAPAGGGTAPPHEEPT